ncbi:hypothetical protein VM1G_11086 [Cytospora mali]|uniref:Uncharacterized protein n=1 Tax=Cytospora mali TaxID=578113 RepID=A0A194VJX6_CYTMA|nr:hypothetical protein VM1G_11086 [Valsa mali]
MGDPNNDNIDITTLPSRVRNLAQRIQSQLGLWPWQLLSSFSSVQRPEINPTYWSIHTIESLNALVTREIEATAATTTTTSRRTRRTGTKQAPDEAHVGGARASRRAVAERIASQLALAVDDRVRKQTKLSRSGDTVLSIPKRPRLTCQDIKKILNVDGGNYQYQDGGAGASQRTQKRRRSHHHEGPQSRGPSEELGEGLGLGQQQQQQQQQQRPSSSTSPTQTAAPSIPAPELSLDNIDLALHNISLPGPSSTYAPLLMLTEAAAAQHSNIASPSPCQNSTGAGNINVKGNGGGNENGNGNGHADGARSVSNTNDSGTDLDRPPSSHSDIPTSPYPRSQYRCDNFNKRTRLSSGRAGSGAESDHGHHDNGSHHVPDDEDAHLVLRDLTKPHSFIDDHERAAMITLTTTSRQETQRLEDEIAKFHESLIHLRAIDKITKAQRDLHAAEAKLRKRNTAEQLLASAIQAAGASDAMAQMRTVFDSYQHETQQYYAAPISTLKTTLLRAQEEAAGLDAARLTAMKTKKNIEHYIDEVEKGIATYEKRFRLWSAYENVIRLGPESLGRLLGRFPGMERNLHDACVKLDLTGAEVEGEGNGGSGSGPRSESG